MHQLERVGLREYSRAEDVKERERGVKLDGELWECRTMASKILRTYF
jgi:Mn-dependent DtxR family transcriptional regulator